MLQDISEEEENELPLPNNWSRQLKADSCCYYKNLATGVESEEHPFVFAAMNLARKMNLPEGWCVRETKNEFGEADYFYYNQTLQLSMWDPPFLRQCLADVLGAHGHSSAVQNILMKSNYPIDTYNNEINSSVSQDEDEDDIEAKDTYDEPDNSVHEMEDHVHYDQSGLEEEKYFQDPIDEPSPTHYVHGDDVVYETVEDIDWPSHNNNRSKKWEELRNITMEKEHPYSKHSHRISKNTSRPPITPTGVLVLQRDVHDANERVHELIVRLRMQLSAKSQISYKLLDSPVFQEQAIGLDVTGGGGEQDPAIKLVVKAGQLVTLFRHQPLLIVSTMAKCYKPGDSGMVLMAFIALHRLLHPFSTDNSMTTALLLQGINYQLDEAAHVEELFPDLDNRMVMSRAIFIIDPSTAFLWNPLAQPMPVVPNVAHETVLTCLLRMYAIRRDVTSFFRTIWRPCLPAVISIINSPRVDDGNTFANLVSVGFRLLECTFRESVAAAFPAVATAMCRALFEIGGNDALHTYIFNLLILPNLVKILHGDHNSIENEDVYRHENIIPLSNKYFDLDSWWPKEGFTSGSYDPIGSLIWIVWRLYTGASLIDDRSMQQLSTPQFFSGGPVLDMKKVPDTKLRSVLNRLQTRIDHGCRVLLKMPLDTEASQFLGLQPDEDHMQDIAQGSELAKHVTKRFTALLLKPDQMLQQTIISRHEMANMCNDIGVGLEISGTNDSEVFRAIAEYMVINDNVGETIGEDYMLLTIPPSPAIHSVSNAENDDWSQSQHQDTVYQQSSQSCAQQYQQLLHGLMLANRYEDTLLRVTQLTEEDLESDLKDLLDDKSWYIAPEFDANFAVDNVEIYEKQTKVSANKSRQSNHGLSNKQTVPAFPLSSNHDATMLEHKSLQTVQQEVFASYRFGTAAPCASVGTSLARKLTCTPKLQPMSAAMTMHKNQALDSQWSRAEEIIKNGGSSRAHPRYTRIDVNPNSNFLVPTESNRQYKTRPPSTRYERQQKFVHSLRDHVVIPTNEFQKRIHSRMSRIQGGGRAARDRIMTELIHPAHGTTGNHNKYSAGPVAKPFPEHLRHRIRGVEIVDNGHGDSDGRYRVADNFDGPVLSSALSSSMRPDFNKARNHNYYSHDNEYDEYVDDERYEDYREDGVGMSYHQDQYGSPDNGGGDAKYYKDFEEEDNYQDDQDLTPEVKVNPNNGIEMATLIRDYQYIFAPAGKRPEFMTSPPSQHSSNANRIRGKYPVPKLPSALPGQQKYFAPTQSLLNRMANMENEVTTGLQDNKFMRDLDTGATPGLRVSEFDGRGVPHATDFIPTGARLSASTGARIPRYMMTQDGEYSGAGGGGSIGTRSRSNSHSHSRANSRHTAGGRARDHLQQPQHTYRDQGASGSGSPARSRSVSPIADSSPSNRYYTLADRSSARLAQQREQQGRDWSNGEPLEYLHPDQQQHQQQQHHNQQQQQSFSPDEEEFIDYQDDDENENGHDLQYGHYNEDDEDAQAAGHEDEDDYDLEADPGAQPQITSNDNNNMNYYLSNCNDDNEESNSQVQGSDHHDNHGDDASDRVMNHQHDNEHDDDDEDDAEEATNQAEGLGAPSVPAPPPRIVPTISKSRFAEYKASFQIKMQEGITVSKHGRSGYPKLKTLTVDIANNAIKWSSVKKEYVILYSSQASSSIALDKITAVRRGIQTEILMKATLVDPNCCLSIITNDRTLDLTMSSVNERDWLLKGLQSVLSSTVQFL